MQRTLNKISYLEYLKCPPEFWMRQNQPLLFPQREKTMKDEHLRQQGYAVEALARQLERFRPDDTKLIDTQRVFQTSEFSVRCDIVVTDKATGAVEIYEVKSTTKFKDEYYDDIAFQDFVTRQSGFEVSGCYVITINGDYVRRGELDPEQLFVVTDVTEEVAARTESTETAARNALAYLDTEFKFTLIDYAQTKHRRKQEFDCAAVKEYFPSLPERTVFHIPRIHPPKLISLLEMGIVDIKDVPEDFELTEKQRAYMTTMVSREKFVDHQAINERMSAWQYPLHFLDYETFSYAIPQFDGVKPYQQMCFQYSLHTIDSPGTEVRHTAEFLARHDEENPPLALAKHLKEALSGIDGTVFVWFDDFEMTRNSELAEMFPDYKDFFDNLNAKTVDLMKVFKDRLYVDPGFGGSSSIKKVLPVLCPDLSYENLGIQEGMTASISWYRAVKWTSLTDAERETTYQNLLEYCELDTKAMVAIYLRLVKECGDASA